MVCQQIGEMTPFAVIGYNRTLRLGEQSSFNIRYSFRLPFDTDDLWQSFICCLCARKYHFHCEARKKPIFIKVNVFEKKLVTCKRDNY